MTIYFADGTSQATAGTAGKVLQVVSSTKTSEYVEDIGGGNYGSDMGLNASITPSSSSNKVLIIISTSQGTSSTTKTGFVVFRAGSVIGYRGDSSGNRTRVAANDVTNSNNSMVSLSGNYLDSPSSTSSLTYSVRIACPAGHWSYLNRQESQSNESSQPIAASTITLMEIAG